MTVPVPDGLKLDSLAERSYDDGIDGAVFGSVYLMFGGFSFLMIYIMITLGKFNSVEQRVVLSLMGMVVILLSLGMEPAIMLRMGSRRSFGHRLLHLRLQPTVVPSYS